MNFKTALSELCNGQNDLGELARRNHLNADQILALKAVSGRCSEMALPSAFIASMMA